MILFRLFIVSLGQGGGEGEEEKELDFAELWLARSTKINKTIATPTSQSM